MTEAPLYTGPSYGGTPPVEPPSAALSYTRRVVIAVGVVVAAFVVLAFLWGARPIVFLAFGAVLFAVLLRGIADGLRRVVPALPDKAAVGLAALVFVGVLVGFGFFIAPQISAEGSALTEQLPQAVGAVTSWLESTGWGRTMLDQMEAEPPAIGLGTGLGRVTGLLGGAFGLFTNTLVVLFAGLFFALDPRRYTNGVARLFPPARRERAVAVLGTVGGKLGGWLLGQLIAMTVVGVLTGVGLWLVGVPLPFALGAIAFACAFVPFLGPFVATIPGVLIALSGGPQMVLYALAVYVGVQQVESYLVSPLVQQRTVSLAPALQMLGAVLGGVLFGLAGTVVAIPALVAVLTLIEEVYEKDLLERRAPPAPAAVAGADGITGTDGIPGPPIDAARAS